MKFWTAIRTIVALSMAGGCGLIGRSGSTSDEDDGASSGGSARPVKRAVHVEMPEAALTRDDKQAPIVEVIHYDDGVHGVPVPYVYGYPLYAEGTARRGILKLRLENYEGAERESYEDEDGVMHVVERLPSIGCRIEGIQESQMVFVPLSLTCELPAPRALGGKKRPVLGELRQSAKVDDVLAEPSIKKAFLGDFHLTSDNFDSGEGEGFFNTDHGQLAFQFHRKRLTTFSYYFDPPVKEWRSAELWVQP